MLWLRRRRRLPLTLFSRPVSGFPVLSEAPRAARMSSANPTEAPTADQSPDVTSEATPSEVGGSSTNGAHSRLLTDRARAQGLAILSEQSALATSVLALPSIRAHQRWVLIVQPRLDLGEQTTQEL